MSYLGNCLAGISAGRKMLGLLENDCNVLMALRQVEIGKAFCRGFGNREGKLPEAI